MDIRHFFKSSTSTTSEATVTATDLSSVSSAEVATSSISSVSLVERPNDLGTDVPVQTKLPISCYPTSKFGNKDRRFNPNWFQGREWLEYSVSLDAAFCFPCHKFCHMGCQTYQRDSIFTQKGFRDWKHGLSRHETSHAHKLAMTLWKELKERQARDKEVTTMLIGEQCERNRYYVQSMMDIVFFLTSNELALRGSDESNALQVIIRFK